MTDLLITLLAEDPVTTGPDFGKASPVGLLVVVLLLIGVFALVRSMNRHLKRVPESFDAPAAEGILDETAPTVAEGGGSATGEFPRESGG